MLLPNLCFVEMSGARGQRGEKMKKEEIGPAIVKYCSEQHISQAELGRRLGLKRQTISDWVRGISYPRLEHFEKLVEMIENN